MSMLPFLDHVEKCEVCRRFPRTPCAKGYELFERGATAMARKYDPGKARA